MLQVLDFLVAALGGVFLLAFLRRRSGTALVPQPDVGIQPNFHWRKYSCWEGNDYSASVTVDGERVCVSQEVPK